MDQVVLNSEIINYEIKRSNRKTIGIRVTENGEIIVSSPNYVSKESIEEILSRKSGWILSKIKSLLDIPVKNNFKDGETLPFLGSEFVIRLVNGVEDKISVALNNNVFYIMIPKKEREEDNKDLIKIALRELFKKVGKKVFMERVELYSNLAGLYPERIFVKGQKTLWGSCSSRNNLNFNYKLLLAPLEVLDYVVLHEICHIKHKNHSKQFWSLLEKYMPDYEKKREWLRQNGRRLEVLE